MSLSTALVNALDVSLKSVGNAEELASAVNAATSVIGSATAADLTKLHAITATAVEANTLAGVTAGTVTASKAVVVGTLKQLDTLAAAIPVVGASTTPGAATQALTLIFKKTGIADNTATSIVTVTCPNVAHSAVILLEILASVAGHASARVGVGYVVLERVAGAALVGTAVALTNTGIATTAAGETLTLAYSLTAASGAVGAANTMDIQVTLDTSGSTAAQVVVLATIINSDATGMTMAAA